MRRGLRRFLPVLLVALAVQLLAPIGLCFAASIASSDPLHGTAFCSGRSDAEQVDTSAPLHHYRDGSCAACCTAASAPPPAPVFVLTNVERQTFRVAWRAFLPNTLAAGAANIAQPRGPPTPS